MKNELNYTAKRYLSDIKLSFFLNFGTTFADTERVTPTTSYPNTTVPLYGYCNGEPFGLCRKKIRTQLSLDSLEYRMPHHFDSRLVEKAEDCYYIDCSDK